MEDGKTGGNKLNAAGVEFKAIHDLMWEISRTGGRGSGGAPLPWLIDPKVRKDIAGLIRKAAQHDAKAADYLAEAVVALGGEVAPVVSKAPTEATAASATKEAVKPDSMRSRAL